MQTASAVLDKDLARRAWKKLCEKGTATREAARLLQVGLQEFLNVFAQKYLGDEGTGEACKLVLGANGEGKTHLLYCIREEAIRRGHLVATVEARNAGAAISPFFFGQHLLKSIETPGSLNQDTDDENPLLRLLREAVEQKRAAILADGLDADGLLLEWADGMRTKNLLPYGLAHGLADGLHAVLRNDVDRALEAIDRIAFENMKLSKDEQQIQGANLLKSIVKLPRLLGFRSLLLLVDEAEVAVEKAGSSKRRTFLSFLRFLNDHVAREDRDSAVVLIACTDEFWPHQFNEYTALKGRLSDPGYDNLDARSQLSLQALVNKNKIWVRETFRGREADYENLGIELLRLGSQVLSGVDDAVQRTNVKRLANVASSNEVMPWVKRNFVKAFGQTVQDQVDEGRQVVLTENEARARFDLAIRQIQDADTEE